MTKLFRNCILLLILAGCNSKKNYEAVFSNPDLYSKTVYQLNTVVMGNNFSPIVASRNYLYANVAAYEIMAAGNPKNYQSLVNQLHGLTYVPQPAPGQKINFNFAALLAFCKLGEAVTFPEGSMKEYVDTLKLTAREDGMPDDMYKNSVEYADSVSAAILKWSKTDNYAQTRSVEDYAVT